MGPDPSDPSAPRPLLQGAVDLSDPAQQTIRDFATQFAMARGTSVIIVGQGQSGQIMATAHVPGGFPQIVGLIEVAKFHFFERTAAKPGGPANG